MSEPDPTRHAPDALTPGSASPDIGAPGLTTPGDDAEAGMAPSGQAARALGERLHDIVEREAADSEEGGDANAPEPGRQRAPHRPSEPEKREAMLFGLGLVPVEADALAGTDLGVCPFCTGYGACSADDLLRVLPVLVEQLAPFPQLPGYHRCPDCDGWGRGLTGARLEESGVQPCPRCNGTGAIDDATEAIHAAARTVEAGAAETPPPLIGPDPMRTPPPQGTPPAVGMVWDQDRYSWVYPQPA